MTLQNAKMYEIGCNCKEIVANPKQEESVRLTRMNGKPITPQTTQSAGNAPS